MVSRVRNLSFNEHVPKNQYIYITCMLHLDGPYPVHLLAPESPLPIGESCEFSCGALKRFDTFVHKVHHSLNHCSFLLQYLRYSITLVFDNS